MGPAATDRPPPGDDGAASGARSPWLAWEPGVRVVVRRRVPGGYSDVLGELVHRGPEGVRVRTRRGEVDVAASDIALGKVVPPAPVRRPRT